MSALLLLTPPSLFAAEDHHTATSAVELGKVAWLSDLDEALKFAAQEDKPVFILFEEVPGCSICRNCGAGPLSHPLITETIDSLFVPLAVFNNRDGSNEDRFIGHDYSGHDIERHEAEYRDQPEHHENRKFHCSDRLAEKEQRHPGKRGNQNAIVRAIPRVAKELFKPPSIIFYAGV